MTAPLRDPFDAAVNAALEELFPTPNPYATDPVGWVRDRTRRTMWSKQREILEALVRHRKVAVHSCHGTGKDWTAANAGAWWIDVHPPNKTMVVSTAPTGDQVKGVLWQEMLTAYELGELPGQLNQTEWWIGKRQVGIGRKPSDYSKQQFQGYHRDFLLVILDEAGGIPDQLWEDAEKLTIADDVPGKISQRILAIGNPDYEGSKFAQVCKPDSGWHVIHIGYDDTPSVTGEDAPDEVKMHLIGSQFVADRAKDYGVDSPTYVAQVLGEFPKDRKDGVVPWSAVQRCIGEEAIARAGEIHLPIELGVDVGGSERGDWTVITGRAGMHAMERPDDWSLRAGPLDAERVVDRILDAIAQTTATAVKVDVAGVGYNVVGSLRRRLDNRERRQIAWPVAVLPFSASEASPMVDQRGRPRFTNVKAEMWWEVGRELSQRGAWDLTALADCPSTIPQLTDVRYQRDKAERVQIEPKDEVKKRTGGSPDHAESLLLAFYTPRAPQADYLDELPAVYEDARGRR